MFASSAVPRDFKGHFLQGVGHHKSNGNKREGTVRGGKFPEHRIFLRVQPLPSQLFPSLSSEEIGWPRGAKRGLGHGVRGSNFRSGVGFLKAVWP